MDEAVLAKELEQLGLPKGAHAATAMSCHARALTAAARRARRRGVQAIQQGPGALARRRGRRHAPAGASCAGKRFMHAVYSPGGAQDPLVLTRWAVDLPLASGGDGQSVVEGAAAGGPTIRLELAAPGGTGGSETLVADEAQLRLLVYELKQAREAMQAACET